MAVRRKSSIWSIRQPVPRGVATVLAFVMPALVLAAWCVVSYGHLAPADFLPSPTVTATVPASPACGCSSGFSSAITQPLST